MSNLDDIISKANTQGQNSDKTFSREDYAAKKKAERDSLFALTSDTASEVTSDGSKFRQYMDIQSRFDRYSAVNALLILAQKPDATRLGNFDYWKGMGASIKPQAKSISILEPHEYTKDDGSPGVGYNVKKVFDISQIQSQRLKADPAPSTYDNRHVLAALVHNPPVPITPVDSLAGSAVAQTNPDTGEILVRKDMKFSNLFGSLAQELAAVDIGANDKTRIDNGFSAYCVSYLLCKKYGVSTEQYNFDKVGDVFEYLDTQEKKAEFQMIRDTFSDISGKMNKHIESLQKTTRNNGAR